METNLTFIIKQIDEAVELLENLKLILKDRIDAVHTLTIEKENLEKELADVKLDLANLTSHEAGSE